ncbi:hypothetical protein [Paenibacillus apiarius]|uniref:hypothetical protein n=1 Tax=Paenibacillus apiarius TaxID=46240 RepID=UPI00197E723E|nr:hypothetical protein [Paenibacillus apiarius]MBN3523249.1 hypothetical protein [Paenibacillus apiarius]
MSTTQLFQEFPLLKTERLRLRQAGLLRQHEFEQGQFVDLAVFALLRQEYASREQGGSSRHG